MMRKEIQLRNENISYELRESERARCLRITVHPGGELSATLPRGMSLEKLEKFIRQKADWILRRMSLAKKRKPAFLIPKSSRREYLEKKEIARKLAAFKLQEFNEYYHLKFGRISIRNQKSRWGSCSQKGNLNFSYRIVHLREKHLNYIIVHELCHLKEFNHSKRFWNLVGETIPDYKNIRKEFRNL